MWMEMESVSYVLESGSGASGAFSAETVE